MNIYGESFVRNNIKRQACKLLIKNSLRWLPRCGVKKNANYIIAAIFNSSRSQHQSTNARFVIYSLFMTV